jgi:hypothetical protein
MILRSDEHVGIESIQGLIFIDCWDQQGLDEFYQTLDSKIPWHQLQSIIVANYELALDSRDFCQYNTLEAYSWTEYVPEMLLPVMKEARNRRTSPWLQKHFKTHSFLILEPNGFLYHRNRCVSHINNWLVIGGGEWEGSTHFRPLGLLAMQNLPGNFYIANWGIYPYVYDGELGRDSLTWIDQNTGLYRLDNH